MISATRKRKRDVLQNVFIEASAEGRDKVKQEERVSNQGSVGGFPEEEAMNEEKVTYLRIR